MGLFNPPKPPQTPPPPGPPQQVADPLWYKSYQSQAMMARGFGSTILTGGDGLGSGGNSYASKTLLGA